MRLGTAGRLQKNAMGERLDSILKIGKTFAASYVFQSDFFPLASRFLDRNVFNDATGEISPESIKEIAGRTMQIDLPFKDYFFFRSTDAGALSRPPRRPISETACMAA